LINIIGKGRDYNDAALFFAVRLLMSSNLVIKIAVMYIRGLDDIAFRKRNPAMKYVSLILIIIGLVIAVYPFADEIYTRYLESQLIYEWDADLSQDIAQEEVSDQYEKLQQLFEELTDESDAASDETENDLEDELSEEYAAETGNLEANSDQNNPAPSAEPSGQKSTRLRAIGRLEIPKIDVNIPILEGASKANLKVGAGHINGTSKIGSIGNAALAAHRSHTYGRMFNRLDELDIGDKIIVTTNDGTFEYIVYKKLVVEPTDTSVLNRSKEDRVLTLITCTPLYTATHRLVIHAVMR